MSSRFVAFLVLVLCLMSALLPAQAQAGDILSLIRPGANNASDEDREFLIDRVGTVRGQIDVGDSLRAIFGMTTLNATSGNLGGITGNDEWTGIYQGKVTSKQSLGGGLVLFTLGPDPAFEADLSGGIGPATGFVPGPGSMMVFFEGSRATGTLNFAADFNDPFPATPPAEIDDGTPSPRTVPPSSADVSAGPYLTEQAFAALARDGAHFWTLGYAGKTGEGWLLLSTSGDTILYNFGITSGSTSANFNFGLTRLFNGNPGLGDEVPVAAVTASGFGGRVEFAGSGQIRGVYDLNTPFEASSNLNFSFVVESCTGAIGDFVWHDLNRNGLQDAGEPGLDGVTVYLKDATGAVIATTTSGFGPMNQHGYYQFIGLCAGTYFVEVVTPPAYAPTSPCSNDQTIFDDSNCSPARVDLTTNSSSNQTIDFGFVTPCTGSVGDFVWHDLDRNGLQDAGEPGLDGVTVYLKDASGAVIATTTSGLGPMNQHGYYQFSGLCAGTYYVVVVTPPGFSPTSPCSNDQTIIDDSNCSPARVDLPTDSTSNQTIDFGFVTPCTGSVGDFVWHDENRNGLQDIGEPGLDGATVNLKNSSGTLIATTTTGVGPGGQHGYYQFTGLCADTYYMEVVTPAGFSRTSPCSADQTIPYDSNCSPAPVNLSTDNDSNQTIDFGFVIPCTGAIGDFVWHDLNRNGLQDANEPGIDGVTVILKDAANTTIGTTTTGVGPGGQHGYYQFTGLCADTYYAEVVTPAGFSPTSPCSADQTTANDSNCSPAPVNLSTDNSSNQTIDFGFVSPCTGSIGDFVWHDVNRNGLQDVLEPGINGVTVNLKNSSGSIIATTTTGVGPGGQHGYYQFTGLCADTYYVEVVTPAGFSPTSPCSADQTIPYDSNCSPAPVNLSTDNSSNQTIDFGFVSPCTGSIGDFVWQDLNGNGVQDAGEPGVPNLTVRLHDCNKTWVINTTTDADGKYSFGGLCGGEYFVEFVLPPGRMFTSPNQGGDPAKDSNADQWTGQTACFTLGPNENNPTIDAGLVGQDLCPPTPIQGFTDTKAGTLYVWQDDQYVHVIYAQSPGLNDNSYGTNIVNWPRSHSFGDLVGSDKVEFIFFDNNGNKVLDFFSDYITATAVSSQYPSGYKSFGPFGGDGSCVFGNCTAALFEWSTSLADNLNELGYCSGGICTVTTPGGVVDLEINSPPTVSPSGYDLKYPAAFPNGWNFTDAYSLTLKKSFFATGLSRVEVGLVHNSPPKAGTNAIDPVPCEPTGPTDCGLSAANPTTHDKQVKQAITNSGSAKATMTGVTITWPSTNGYLSKIKFDGDVIWDGTIRCSGTPPTCSATLTSSQLMTDVKKKSIDPGKTRQLIFEFEKNASTNLALYSWKVDFGPGCSVSFPPGGPTCGGGIGDFVWNDTNGNGLQDTGEPGIAGVSLTLKMGGSVKATTTTNSSGYYQFTGLCAGTYTVELPTPFGFVATTPCGSDQTTGNDSNCSPATVTLATDNSSNLTIDFGFKSSGPGDGILMCPATPIPGFSGPVGVLFVTVDANGDVTVRYDQSRGLNDNSYGTNIVQWPRSHTFTDLVNSDKAQFMFYDKNGTKVLDFYLDYLHAKSGTPSGYASLGPDGGDGSMVSGTRSNILAWTTSLADNLNTTWYCSSGNCSGLGTNLLVNSPPTVSSSSYDLPPGSPYGSWNFTNSYSVKISHLAFPTGFGRVTLGVVHDSPPKVGSNAVYPVPCP